MTTSTTKSRMTPQQFRKVLKREEKNRPDFYQGIYAFRWDAAFIDRCPSARDFRAFVSASRRVCAHNDAGRDVLARFAFARFCALEIDEWELAEAVEGTQLHGAEGILDRLQGGLILTGELREVSPSEILSRYKISLATPTPAGFSTLAEFVAAQPVAIQVAMAGRSSRGGRRPRSVEEIVVTNPVFRHLYREINFAVSIARDYLADPSVQARITERKAAISLECERMDLIDALIERGNALLLAQAANLAEDGLFG